MLTPHNRPGQSRCAGFCKLVAALTLLMLSGHQLYALPQTFSAANQWVPANWHFTYTNGNAVVYFTNSTTVVYSARKFALQPSTDTSITPPSSGLSAVYSNTACILSFEDSTNGVTWYPAQSTGYVYMAVINTNSPMTIQMTNSFFSGSNGLGTFRIRANTTKVSSGQTLLTPTTGGYLISGFLNVQWEGFGSGISWKAANTNAYLELSGPSAAPSIKLQISQPTSGTVQVCWPTQTNYVYQLQKNTNPATTNWSNVGSPQSGNGATVCESYSAVGNNLNYRVVATNTVP